MRQVFVVLLLFVTPILFSVNSEVIVLQDKGLDFSVRKALGKLSGDLTLEDLSKLKNIRIGNHPQYSKEESQVAVSIKSLRGLEKAVNLEEVDIHQTVFLHDISLLSQLPKLTSLWIYLVNQIDFPSIQELKRLKKFSLTSESVIDAGLFKNFPDLEHLFFEAPVTNMSALSELPKLTYLLIQTYDEADEEQIYNLKNLSKLVIYNPKKLSRKLAAAMTNLKALTVFTKSQRPNLDFLYGFSRLESLTIYSEALIPALSFEPLRVFDKSPYLKTLSLRNFPLEVGSYISSLPNLTSLSLVNCGTSNIEFVRDSTKLYSIELNGSPVSDLSPLLHLDNLRQIHLHFVPIKTLYSITQLKNKVYLNLYNNGLDLRPNSTEGKYARQIIGKEDLSKITKDRIDDRLIPNMSLKADIEKALGKSIEAASPSDFSKIESIHLAMFTSSLDGIELLTGLTSLTITSRDLNHLERVRSLKKLRSIVWNTTDYSPQKDLTFLRELPNLERLTVPFLPGADLSGLPQSLKELTVAHVTKEMSKEIAKLKNLELLSIGFSPEFETSIIANLPNLRRLDLSGCDIKSVNFEIPQKLTTLDLSGNQITDISFLKKLPELTALNLSGNKLRDLAPLANLKSLAEIVLKRTSLDFGSFADLMRKANFGPRAKIDITLNDIDFMQSAQMRQYLSDINKHYANLNFRLGNIMAEDSDTGKSAPIFSAPDKNGKVVSNSIAKGKYYIVEFGADWCFYCKQQAAYMNEVKRKLAKMGIPDFEAFTLLNEEPSEAARILKTWDEKYQIKNILFDENGQWSQKFGSTAVPSTVVVRPDGKIAYILNGSPSTADNFITVLKSQIPEMFINATNPESTPPPLPSQPPAQADSWAGMWIMSWGTGEAVAMRLDGSSTQVSGTYDFKGGKLTGATSGNHLIGSWTQTNSSGWFDFVLSPDKKSFSGTWGRTGDQTVQGTWSGTKKSR